VQRAEIPPGAIDQIVFGTVIPSVQLPNIAREIGLAAGLPKSVDAYSVVRACATSIQAMTSAADAIALGEVDLAIAGGAEALSDVPITYSRPMAQAVVAASRGRSLMEKLQAFHDVSAKDLLPVPPAIAEYSTGLSMGESAEKMAKENGITREAQDAWAHRSHQGAARAWASGAFSKEVMHVLVPPKFETSVSEDNIVRKDSQLESYAKLKPVFDRKYGSITAGNASPLTDGAAAIWVASDAGLARADDRRARARASHFPLPPKSHEPSQLGKNEHLLPHNAINARNHKGDRGWCYSGYVGRADRPRPSCTGRPARHHPTGSPLRLPGAPDDHSRKRSGGQHIEADGRVSRPPLATAGLGRPPVLFGGPGNSLGDCFAGMSHRRHPGSDERLGVHLVGALDDRLLRCDHGVRSRIAMCRLKDDRLDRHARADKFRTTARYEKGHHRSIRLPHEVRRPDLL